MGRGQWRVRRAWKGLLSWDVGGLGGCEGLGANVLRCYRAWDKSCSADGSDEFAY